jgi:hypothetical protein
METMAVNNAQSAELLLMRLLNHFSTRQDVPPAFLLLSTHRMKNLTYDPTSCFQKIAKDPAAVGCCDTFERASGFVATPASVTTEPEELQLGVMSYYGFGAISHRRAATAAGRDERRKCKSIRLGG